MLSWSLLPCVAAAATSWETLNCKDLFSYYSVQTYGGGSPLHVNLRGFSPRNHKIEVIVDSAPTSSFGYAPGAKKHDAGTLHKPSMTYCKYGYKEEITGDKLSFPHKVSCKRANALLVLPTTQKIPEHVPIAQIRYHVKDLVENWRSCPGIVHVLNNEKMLTASVFDKDTEGWTVERNGRNGGPPTHDTASMGKLNDFIFSQDMEIDTNNAGLDRVLWQFVAPTKFHGDFAVAYGGSLSFTIATTTGPFEKTVTGKAFNNDRILPQTNSEGGNLPVVTLECATCLVTREDPKEATRGEYGVRLVFPLSKLPQLWANKATSANVEIPLKADAGWLIDPRNEHLQWTPPSKCELATVLHRVSKLSILGDYSPRFETVALDNVKVRAGGPPPTQCHRQMFPQTNYIAKQSTAPLRKYFAPSVKVKVTKTVKFKDNPRLCPSGGKGPVSAEGRAIFMQECNQAYSDRKMSVQCGDVRCGSVLVDLVGEKTDVEAAVNEIKSQGLQLPTFSKLTVAPEQSGGGGTSGGTSGGAKSGGDANAKGATITAPTTPGTQTTTAAPTTDSLQDYYESSTTTVAPTKKD